MTLSDCDVRLQERRRLSKNRTFKVSLFHATNVLMLVAFDGFYLACELMRLIS
jgi:hypothetical protein